MNAEVQLAVVKANEKAGCCREISLTFDDINDIDNLDSIEPKNRVVEYAASERCDPKRRKVSFRCGERGYQEA